MAGDAAGRKPRYVFLCDGVRGREPAGRFGWRLAAANHRPLGRARIAHTSLDECRADASRLRREWAALRSILATEAGLWTWQLTIGAEPVAVCVHPYARRIECVRGLNQFLEAAGIAEPDEGVVRYFGPHSLRGFLFAEAADA
jgi:hypothetical protein